MAKTCGVEISDAEKEQLAVVFSMPQFEVWKKIFQRRVDGSDTLAGIDGTAFNDGKVVGRHEGIKSDLNFLLDICKEICNRD